MRRIFIVVAMVIALAVLAEGQVVPTNEWVSFWSDSTWINRTEVPVGAVVRAYDPQGVLCGQFTVTATGSYGLMSVYRDDPSTAADEGAQPGDTIHFTINNRPAVVVGPAAIWTANGDVKKVNLAVEQPAMLVTPSTGVLGVVQLWKFTNIVFWVKNVGLKPLNVDSIVVGYKFPHDFVPMLASSSIQPGDSSRLDLQFNPSVGSGPFCGALSIYSNSADSARYQLSLSGSIQTDVTPTNEWVSFWSDSSSFDGQPLKPGDVVDVYDPQGVHCGTFNVTASGHYGLVPVYRDDATTSTVDEGAQPGDTLFFTIDGYKATVWGSGPPVWTANGAVFKLNLSAKSSPSLTGAVPPIVYRLQTTNVVLSGAGFATGLTGINFGPGITWNYMEVNSPTRLTANITVSAAVATGVHQIYVSNDGFIAKIDTLKSGFAVYNPAPTLTGLSVSSGNRWQTLNVTFTGTNFIAGETNVNVGTGITVNSVTVNSATSLVARITIAGNAALGSQSFSVSNGAPGGGTSGTQAFSIVKQVAASLAVYSGNSQSAALDSLLPGPLVVVVKDSASHVIEGIGVRFVISSAPTGATLQALSDSVVTTDSTGTASDRLRLGTKTGTYLVTATAVGTSLTPVTFTASSPSAKLVLSVKVIAFADVGINDSLDVTLKITNGSLNPLIIDSIYTHTTAFRSLVAKATVGTDTLKLVVRFNPKKFLGFADTLFLRNNSDTSLVKVPLTGNSPYSTINVSLTALTFGSVLRNGSKSISFKVTNSSISALELDSLFTHTTYFRVTTVLTSKLLRKLDTLSVSIRFQPDSVRLYVDTLTIINNSAIPSLKLILTGAGVLTGVDQFADEIPTSFRLFQNFPNPFNPSTKIRYSVPVQSRVRLEIFNSLGQRVVTLIEGERSPGNYEAEWLGAVTSGIYICRFNAISTADPSQHYSEARKMILLK